jgi:hypothetical protein
MITYGNYKRRKIKWEKADLDVPCLVKAIHLVEQLEQNPLDIHGQRRSLRLIGLSRFRRFRR